VRSKLVCLSVLGLLATSCSTVGMYRGPVEELSKGTVLTRTAIEELSRDVNELTVRNRAWAAAARSERFGDRELAPIISPAFVQARTGVVLMIERLAAQMLRAVSSEAGTSASAGVVLAAAEVKAFAAGIDPKGPVKDYAEPLGGLAQVVMDLHGDVERQALLRSAIERGIPAAKAALALLKRDFKPGSATNIDAVKIEELRTLKAQQIAAYDRLLADEAPLPAAERGSSARVEARYSLLRRIIATQQVIDGTANDGVYQTLVSLEESLDALLAASKGDLGADALPALVERLAVFAGNATALMGAVRNIKVASSGQGPE
jgi:hypothetical protein